MSFFESISLANPDPIFGLMNAFKADSRATKVNLGVGVYRDEHLNTPILHTVKKAERLIWEEENSKEYLPIEGDHLFIHHVGLLLFGERFSDKIAGFQTPGGTGALCIGAAFLHQYLNNAIYLPSPSWPNHKGVFSCVGLAVGYYPYYASDTRSIQFEKMILFLSTLSVGSIVLFHASCHNPTGSDLNLEQWKILGGLCIKKQLIPFFDCAYQGLGRGLHEDVEAIRLFIEMGVEMLVAISQSKNFSLYAERVGALYVVTHSKEKADQIKSRVKQQIRTHYSNPPLHGAKIVSTILGDKQLYQEWEKEVNTMRIRINRLRDVIASELIQRVKDIDFSYLQKGLGMFCFTGLNERQVENLIQKFGIYMTRDGRMNICGINTHNLEYVIDSMIKVIHYEHA